jgi:hypothetical protein
MSYDMRQNGLLVGVAEAQELHGGNALDVSEREERLGDVAGVAVGALQLGLEDRRRSWRRHRAVANRREREERGQWCLELGWVVVNWRELKESVLGLEGVHLE